nr:MAG: DNA pilot protein [Microviridae sp.]
MAWLALLAPVIAQVTAAALKPGQDAEQLQQQGALDQQQLNYNEQGAEFGINLANESGSPLSYPAQVNQMNEAGLNPALMYAKGGGGGQMIGGMSVGSAQAPTAQPLSANDLTSALLTGIKTASEVQVNQAQTENIKADTAKKNVEVPNIEASTASITQGITNQQLAAKLTQAQTTAVGIANAINKLTIVDQQDKIKADAEAAISNAKILLQQAHVDAATVDIKIATLKTEMVGKVLQNMLTSSEITNVNADTNLKGAQTVQSGTASALNQQQIKASAAEIVQKYMGLNLQNTTVEQQNKAIENSAILGALGLEQQQKSMWVNAISSILHAGILFVK